MTETEYLLVEIKRGDPQWRPHRCYKCDKLYILPYKEDKPLYNFCPYCGAKMDTEGNT